MQTAKKNSDRKKDEKLKLPFKMSLYDQSGKAINISAAGVYFEVITEDTEAFSQGATIPIQITAKTSAPDNGEGKIKLNGNGTIIRNKIKDITSHHNKVSVAVQFNENLNISEVSI